MQHSQSHQTVYDLIVIGGGISGLGIAREASRRQLHTLLLEKEACARATSDNSMRIIHGGFRYLQTLNIPRVVTSLRDQTELLCTMPDLVKPLECLMPLKPFGIKSRSPVSAALKLYQLLARVATKDGRERGSIVSSDYIDNHVPVLKGMATHGALLWHDAIMPDQLGLSRAVVEQIKNLGGEILEQHRVGSIRHADHNYQVSAHHNGQVRDFFAHSVVNASGPWLHTIDVQLGRALPRTFPAGWCMSCNLVLARQLEKRYAIGVSSPSGRLYFSVPRDKGTVVGTHDIVHRGSLETLRLDTAELEWFVSDFNRALPSAKVGCDEVIHVEKGVLPLQSERNGKLHLYGKERILAFGGYIEVMSTKYTTFQSQARKTVARVAHHLDTLKHR